MWASFSFFVAIFAWFVILEKTRKLYKKGHLFTHTSSFYYLIMSFFIALTMTFQIDTAYLTMSQITEIPNIAWLLANSSLILTVYFSSAGSLLAVGKPVPLPFKYLTVLSILILWAIFPVGIMVIPDKPEHIIPESFLEYLFMMVFYVHVFAVGCFMSFAYYQIYREEAIKVTKLRWLMYIIVMFAVILCMFSRGLSTTIAWFDPTSLFIEGLHYLTLSTFILAGVAWFISYFLQRAFIDGPAYFANRKTLSNLKRLHDYLRQFHRPIVSTIPSLTLIWGNFEFYIYCSTIGIIDAKEHVFDSNLIDLSILERLQKVNDNLPFDEVVKQYSDIGQELKTSWNH